MSAFIPRAELVVDRVGFDAWLESARNPSPVKAHRARVWHGCSAAWLSVSLTRVVEVKVGFRSLALHAGLEEIARVGGVMGDHAWRLMIGDAGKPHACEGCGRWGYHLKSCSRGPR